MIEKSTYINLLLDDIISSGGLCILNYSEGLKNTFEGVLKTSRVDINDRNGRRMNIMKKVIQSLLGIVLLLSVVIILGVAYLTITDYKPDEVETLEVVSHVSTIAERGNVISLSTWNIGYSGLGAKEDFFMDDGVKTQPNDISVVEGYLEGIKEVLTSIDTDIIMLQEIDIDAKRSFYMNQKVIIDELLSDYDHSFGKNYDVTYVPVPLPPMGKVKAGIGLYSQFQMIEATRYSLPGEFKWPKKVVMLDRCIVSSRFELKDSDADLIIINAHFSAYGDGEMSAKQLEYVKSFITNEYNKGNYVILGGDWNQTFPKVDVNSYPLYQNGDYWLPNNINEDWISDDWTFAYGDGTPTYRLLNEPYQEGVTQTGVIDGFILSPNIHLVSSEVIDLNFEFSDHNPVVINVVLD